MTWQSIKAIQKMKCSINNRNPQLYQNKDENSDAKEEENESGYIRMLKVVAFSVAGVTGLNYYWFWLINKKLIQIIRDPSLLSSD